MPTLTPEIIKEKVSEAIESDPYKDYIRAIYLFGSYLHGDAKPDSDVDLLVELSKPLSFFKIISVQYNLSKTLGKEVDLGEKDSVHHLLKKQIHKEAKKIYDREQR